MRQFFGGKGLFRVFALFEFSGGDFGFALAADAVLAGVGQVESLAARGGQDAFAVVGFKGFVVG